MAVHFDIGKIDGEDKYFEVNITDDDKAYYPLFNFFLNPQSIVGDHFEKIFKNIQYQDNHKLIEENPGFFSWNGWLFRGQQDSSWKLKTSFERLIHNRSFDRDYYELEMGMLRDFRRKAFNYAPNLEAIDEMALYEWIANFQHYGGKTRFMDTTFSFFVALFFAVSDIEFDKSDNTKKGNNEKNSFSIWCFNRMWIEKRYKEFLPEPIKTAYKKDLFGKNPETQKMVLEYVPNLKKTAKNGEYQYSFLSVINMTPFKMNRRLINQKGSFLFPTNPYQSFEKNLFNMIDLKKNPNDIYRVIKLNVEYDNRSLVYILNLLDMMNNNYNVLYESFEGMCQQINFKTRLPNDALIVPPTGNF